jgi:peptidoglycan-associated lipoprotein
MPIRQATDMAARLLLAAMIVAAAGCAKRPPVARPTPPPAVTGATPGTSPGTSPSGTVPAPRPPAPPEPVAELPVVPAEPVRDDAISSSATVDDLNRNSPLKPVFYDYDSAELSPEAQATLNDNAAFLKKYPTWAATIEGHCDERGTAEYNLALGERRAQAAHAYLVSIGISADRLRTVSYGKEFPFEPGQEEPAFAKNRRAHFVITAK